MKKYQLSKTELRFTEGSCVPYAVYQFVDKHVKTLALSKGFCDLFGFTDFGKAYDVMDNDMYRDTHPDDKARVAEAALLFAKKEKPYDVVYRSKKDGTYHVIHAFGKHVYTEDGTQLAYVWYSDEGECDGKNNIAADTDDDLDVFFGSGKGHRNYDSLTGLPNMTYFFELVDTYRAKARQNGETSALLFIDLSGMNFFNREYGFVEGDKLIRSVSILLTKRFSAECCSRFGQDHFAAVTNAENVEGTINAIFKECKSINGGNSLPLRVGIYLDTAANIPSNTCFDRAKLACNVTRKAYYSHFRYFNDSMLKGVEKNQYIINNIDKAIENGWIKVYYQPIIRAANGRVSDEEALARWEDPEKGMLSPADFIPTLEDAKLISKLDLFVVDSVLAKIKALSETNSYVIPISINLSRIDFENYDMVSEIDRRVEAAGVDRGKITIEITESVVGSDPEFIKKQIDKFHKAGFRVWMDDFGSGYSSLDVLQSMSFDVIKLDMRFTQHLNNGEKCKIILTELANMATGLGIDVVAEGVETKEQAEFLTEIGCTKLQGYYFSKPLPLEEILRRKQTDTIQIGFENPAESDYYSAIGKINLYDASAIAENGDSAKRRLNALPMAVLEVAGEEVTVIRSNNAYRTFIKDNLGFSVENSEKYVLPKNIKGTAFLQYLYKCAETGMRYFVNDKLPDGSDIQTVINRISINPTNGVVACVVVIASIQRSGRSDEKLTYAHIAQALSADYFRLYYVNLNDESFIEYSPNVVNGNLTVERHGESFFSESRKDTSKFVYEEDREKVLAAFNRENIIEALNDHGVFTLTYRLMAEGVPTYVSMKVIRMHPNSKHIIIGVNNIDAQMKQQEAMERIKEERITYERITALSGEFIAIYTVDPTTNHYTEYSATRDYEGLGLAKEGDDFFNVTRELSRHFIYIEDLTMFETIFTKENVVEGINKNGIFILNYRLMMQGKPTYICLKAAKIVEKDGPQLIVGIMNVDDQVKRDLEYAKNLNAARNKADTDALTGLKNKHAYIDVEHQIDEIIYDKKPVEFAVIVCDVNGLKKINDTLGHSAGDTYLQSAADVLRKIFEHSPIFRVGGDEFAVIAQGQDYENVHELVEKLHAHNRESRVSHGV